ncbi:hypothetical protein NDU88_003016 [Pleurodeles waltl]|uniref:Uncharacterized protein n=1 Tax=Pleurodeles waltl TaxID=8319 RepID=A0AAV7W4F6_PLEWA|nr:hypothetical protein NDU88_003016 [Pleurodeles waltl]
MLTVCYPNSVEHLANASRQIELLKETHSNSFRIITAFGMQIWKEVHDLDGCVEDVLISGLHGKQMPWFW